MKMMNILSQSSSRTTRFCRVLMIMFIATGAEANVIHVTFNELDIGIDKFTGSIVSLSSPPTGLILVAEPANAGLLDVAFPVESFAAMRLASRFSQARITQQKDRVTIRWDKLAASRPNLELPGGVVHAEVTIEAADDGRSVIFRSRIQNESDASVRQVLFPDLWGLKPFAGVENTRLRRGGGVTAPFNEPLKGAESTPFYAGVSAIGQSPLQWNQYKTGGYSAKRSTLRWLDFGGFDSGLSVFQKKWGTFDWPNVLTRRTERDPMSLRMVWEHTQAIAPGQSWESGEFWLTPHAGGWAKGIEVYRDYVQTVNPSRSVPRHVQEDIGYQTIWMIQTVEVDPAKAFFRYEDLPRVAEDARLYGIHEVVPWGWNVYSTMPIPIRPELGSIEDLIAGVEKSRDLGVNIAPFISLSIVRNQYAERYGVEPSDNDWTYHYELIPQFRPYYTKFWNGVEINSNNGVWQTDVLESLSQWIERGVTSFSWDVYKIHPSKEEGKEPPLLLLTEKIRKLAQAKNPESTFSGESITHLEFDSQALDYLWNWRDYLDAAPITNVLKAPRLNCNVEDSAMVVAKCFADNLYMNVMPRKLDAPNGTALISEEPVLAAALLRVSKLRKQFLPYFVDGTFIGDSVLSEPSGAFVRGYQLGDRLFMIVLNDRQEIGTYGVQSDLGLWLPPAQTYRVVGYNDAGNELGSTEFRNSQWFGTTPRLEPGQMAFFEIMAK